ncbi:MAG: tRNA (adenosine(37)-N6)-dimethylallyltransferase MiaA [Chloroflexi bacterium]|nr:tRNA (adenosine(37)-N6)-dimethylallyltransferase MiaA [Chloroflexota bacterium]
MRSTEDSRILLIAIVGPTAIGKTELAIEVAERHRGEIVGADSRQVYRGLDIGTGKPSAGERARVPHHLIDVVNPGEEFSVALFQRLASQAIVEIHGRGRLPVLVGGTGHWVWALLKGFRLPQVPPNEALRSELYSVGNEADGVERLNTMLRDLDPVAAQRIDPRNIRRVVRAIEVTRTLGVPFSQVATAEPPPYRPLVIGLTASREVMDQRIDARVEAMFAAGWVDEVRGLLAGGCKPDLPSLSGLGYPVIVRHLEGDLSLAEAIEQVKRETRRFARRQYQWFRPSDEAIRWIDITKEPLREAEEAIRAWMAG